MESISKKKERKKKLKFVYSPAFLRLKYSLIEFLIIFGVNTLLWRWKLFVAKLIWLFFYENYNIWPLSNQNFSLNISCLLPRIENIRNWLRRERNIASVELILIRSNFDKMFEFWKRRRKVAVCLNFNYTLLLVRFCVRIIHIHQPTTLFPRFPSVQRCLNIIFKSTTS